MIKNVPKREIKDSVFTDLFQDKKYLLQLYQTLHPEDRNISEDEITDVTIKHVFVGGDYNDLDFSVGDRFMVLVESQSTWTVNIIIRALMYLVQTYHDYIKRTNQNLYGSKKVNLPKPELYVIYTGERNHIPDTISLSKEFFGGRKVAIDAEVKILYQENENDIIGQYIIFSKVYTEQRRIYGQSLKAITETIRICKDRNILKEYLESKELEVVDMMWSLFDQEYAWKAREKELEEEAEKRYAKETKRVVKETAKRVEKESTIKNARETAKRMIRDGEMSLEKIASYLPSLSMEELKELEAEIKR